MNTSDPERPLAESAAYRDMVRFFVPLGLSSLLVTMSHTIINGTLARSSDPETAIAGYAIAMSIFVITERPAVLLRQTCSVLVRDRLSFSAMSRMTALLLACTIAVGLLLSWTPAGGWILRSWFHADAPVGAAALDSYRILIFVTVFSAIRCLFHGIIIREMRTAWLTIGMVIRLVIMYALSLFFVHVLGWADGRVGAVIFLVGMMVEAAVSMWEGRHVLRTLPDRSAHGSVSKMRDIFPFYRPLVLSSLLAVAIPPSVNAMLGKTADLTLAVASYALAMNITNLVTSFFSYVHQIVLNFYADNPRKVRRFCTAVNLVPPLLLAMLAWTPVGTWFMRTIMGVGGDLLSETRLVLNVCLLHALAFPWVDYGNGLVMLRKRTRIMVRSQSGNVAVTLAVLTACVALVPEWNGRIGALAISLGLLAELAVLAVSLRLIGTDRTTAPAADRRAPSVTK
jgi:hypothetical protein